MLFSLFSTSASPIFGLLSLGLILLSIAIHEFSHALAALWLGDPTAKMEGRLTLNPLAHFDVIGLLAILFTRFGWGKSVPITPQNFNNPVRDSAIVSLAGPLSNFVFAGILLLSMKLISVFIVGNNSILLLESILIAFVVSVSLGLFNLLPLYPLDGEKILRFLLPLSWRAPVSSFLKTYSIPLLILAIIPILPGGRSILGLWFTPLSVIIDSLLTAVGII